LCHTAAMFVRASGVGEPAELVEPEDCTRFHVEYHTAGATPAEVAAALGDWADGATDDHVWVRISALRNAAAGRIGPGWDDRFDAMVAYARSKGWVNGAGDALAAHVETPG
jgi:hypothetical protein